MNILRKAALIISAVTALSAAAFTLDLPIETINGIEYYVYRVAPKETVYSITRKLGITRDQLIQANPAVADGLRAGETLLFPTDKTQPTTKEEPKEEPQETPEEAPEEAPQKNQEEESPIPPITPIPPISPITPSQTPITPSQEEPEPQDTLSISIILPFMLESENMTKSAENFTNFYRGFLLATDSLAAKAQVPVCVYAFDSEGSSNKVNELITNPDVRNSNFIIAPDDASAINSIVAVTDSTDALVLNLFAVKNDGYRSHESLLQGNISHDSMYASAINAFCKNFKDKKVILLNATDIPAEKSSFTSALTAKLVSAGIPYEKLDYAGKLTEQDLAQFPTAKDYVFVPTSHSREALMRILPTLEEYKQQNPSAALFGYPEWIVLQGDIKNKLHQINTTIYSRFASNPSSDNYKRIAASFEGAYGTPLERTIPNQALLGFDAAAWILQAATSGVEIPYSGAQNSFNFKEVDGGGFENNSLYFINFAPEGSTEIILL